MKKLLTLLLFLATVHAFGQLAPPGTPTGPITTNTKYLDQTLHRWWTYHGITYGWTQDVDSLQLKQDLAGIPVLTFTAPLIKTGTVISIPAAATSANGYLTSTDWNIFNGKQSAITLGTSSQYFDGTLSLRTFPTALPPSGVAGGDLTGTYPNPTVNTINSVTKSYYDPTSSIQTQLNAKQSLANLETTITNSSTLYPSGSAVTTGLALKLNISDTANMLLGLVHKSGFSSQTVAGTLNATNIVGLTAVVAGSTSNISFLSSSGLKIETGSASVYTSYEKDNIVFNDLGTYQQRFTPTSGTLAMNSIWELGNTGFARDTVASQRFVRGIGAGYFLLAGGNTAAGNNSFTGANTFTRSGVNFCLNCSTGNAMIVTNGILDLSGRVINRAEVYITSTNASLPESYLVFANSGVSVNNWVQQYVTTGLAFNNLGTTNSITFASSNNGDVVDHSGNYFFKSTGDTRDIVSTHNSTFANITSGASGIITNNGSLNNEYVSTFSWRDLTNYLAGNWTLQQNGTAGISLNRVGFVAAGPTTLPNGGVTFSVSAGGLGTVADQSGNLFAKNTNDPNGIINPNASSFASVGIGTGSTSITPKLQTVETSTAAARGVWFDQYSAGTQSSRLYLRKARGTFASPTTVVTGDIVSNVVSSAYDGTNFIDAAQFRTTTTGTVAAGNISSFTEIQTAKAGTLATGLTIDQNQAAIFNRSIRQLSTGTGGYKSFSTADTTTNTADIYIGHTSGTAYVMTENAGTGTLEPLTVASGGTAGPSLTVNGVSGASNKTLLAAGSTALTTTAIHAVTATGTAASGTQIYQGWTFTDNQTSTAATTALNLNYIPTAAGSGSHLLMNLQNNGANKFQTDVNGISFTSNRFGIQSSAPTSVFQVGANNSSSANYSLVGFGVNIGSITLTSTTSSGTISAASAHSFSQPTLAASSATTLSKSYGVMFNSVPIAGTNMTLTAAGKFAVGITGAFEVSANANILGDLLVNTSTDSTAYKLQVNGRAKIGQFIAANTNDSLMAYNPTTHGLRMTKLVSGAAVTVTYGSGTITIDGNPAGLIVGTPTIVAGTGAGTAPTVSVTSNGRGLQVTVTTGTLPTGTNATVATVTLANALSYTPYPVYSSASGATALLSGASMVYMTSTGTSNVTITSGTTALTAATTYIWNVSL